MIAEELYSLLLKSIHQSSQLGATDNRRRIDIRECEWDGACSPTIIYSPNKNRIVKACIQKPSDLTFLFDLIWGPAKNPSFSPPFLRSISLYGCE
jgi:hypothetical protein